jgi:hypothetical protein
VEVKDGVILKAEPKDMVGYVAVPFWKWFQELPYA